MPEVELIPVSVIALVEDQISSSPIVLLHDKQLDRLLPIWIGDPEARAIAIALNKTVMPRPLTHRLLLNIIEAMEGKLSRVVVDRLERNTYFASVYVQMEKKNIVIDARPSDAVAIALESGTPIFVAKAIMDKAAQKNPFPDVVKQEKREKKLDFTKDDLEKIKKLIEKARERERQS
ncbi:bifunctional nuclease family protein [Candidatus Peregrinibacteria bacterium]|nr:bifunctional nuclease family protein [Candidatus Peregrinibacteria bacterium]